MVHSISLSFIYCQIFMSSTCCRCIAATSCIDCRANLHIIPAPAASDL
jgi:hypothetical protein